MVTNAPVSLKPVKAVMSFLTRFSPLKISCFHLAKHSTVWTQCTSRRSLAILTSKKNYQITFKKRPGVDGIPSLDNFGYEKCSYPGELSEGGVLIKTMYLSVDPAQRCQMNEDTGVEYVTPWILNDVIQGLQGVGVIEKSNHSNYTKGELVQGTLNWPWKMYFDVNLHEDAGYYSKVDKSLVGDQASLVLSAFGIVGLTAILGVREKGHVMRGANQTFVVSGAAGGVGSLAGQIAKLEGCGKVIGICGSKVKCQWITEELGFDHAINYKEENVDESLKHYCTEGVDIYFDNVSGPVTETVIHQMNKSSHIILCGAMADYNSDLPYPPILSTHQQNIIQSRNITRDRFLVLDYTEKFEQSIKQLAEWVYNDKLKVAETVEEGLENTGMAFVKMMTGKNIGKQIVHVSDI